MIDASLKHDPHAGEDCPLCKALDETSDKIVEIIKREGGLPQLTFHLLTWTIAKLITQACDPNYWDRSLLDLVEEIRARFDRPDDNNDGGEDETDSNEPEPESNNDETIIPPNGQSRSIH